jgi:hypothetical protein
MLYLKTPFAKGLKKAPYEQNAMSRKRVIVLDDVGFSEQAQGINKQLNKAISEMDSVVQRVAANAEETPSTSEEMNAQSEQLKGMVGDLTALVGHAAEGKRVIVLPKTASVTLNTELIPQLCWGEWQKLCCSI